MMLAFALGAAVAAPPAAPQRPQALSTFDLPPATAHAHEKQAAPLDPVRPRNLDLRDSNAPEAEWQVVQGGPVFVVGAMGGRGSGRPKLAHVAVDWSF